VLPLHLLLLPGICCMTLVQHLLLAQEQLLPATLCSGWPGVGAGEGRTGEAAAGPQSPGR
jgi:hypothetical protein